MQGKAGEGPGRSLQIEGKRQTKTDRGYVEKVACKNLGGTHRTVVSMPLPGVRWGDAFWEEDMSHLPETVKTYPGAMVYEMW